MVENIIVGTGRKGSIKAAKALKEDVRQRYVLLTTDRVMRRRRRRRVISTTNVSFHLFSAAIDEHQLDWSDYVTLKKLSSLLLVVMVTEASISASEIELFSLFLYEELL